MGADVVLLSDDGQRLITIGEFFQSPNNSSRQLKAIRPDETLTGIVIPAPQPKAHSVYLKAMPRHAWAFAQASLAMLITFNGKKVDSARIVLGGVAPIPWRLTRAEEMIMGQTLEKKLIKQVVSESCTGATTLSHNEYKVSLIQGLVTRVLMNIKPV